MQINEIIHKLQTIFKVTKSELTAVGMILLGLSIGFVYKTFVPIQQDTQAINYDEIYRLLDSLAEVNKTTFTGTNIYGESDSTLSLADTTVKKESFFPGSSKKTPPSSPININSASKIELMKLPGIGESTAEKIIEYRKINKFRSIIDIKNVKGIGDKKFEKIKSFLTVK